MGEHKEAKTTIANMCPICARCGHVFESLNAEHTSKGCDTEGAKQK